MFNDHDYYEDVNYIVQPEPGGYYPPAQASPNPYPSPQTRPPLFGLKERSLNRQIAIGNQVEKNRAELSAIALENTNLLAQYEQSLIQDNPAAAEYFEAILEGFVESSCDSIRNFGRSYPNNPFINNSRNRNYRR